MAKKNKGTKNASPNAPELQQILLDSPTSQQPPHNPYYPDLGTSSVPPPPYSDLSIPKHIANSVPMSQFNNQNSASEINYSRLIGSPAAPQAPATVIIQPPVLQFDYRREKRNRKIRSFNSQMILVAILTATLALYAYSLYNERPCVEKFIVHVPSKDLPITIRDVRDAHKNLAYYSIFMLIVCLLKCGCTNTKSHSCYLLIIGLTTFFATLATGYLAYLTFYSPCTTNAMQQIQSGIKTVIGNIVDSLPSPDKGELGETSVLQWAKNDRAGFWIFCINLSNFFLYLSSFLSATILC